MRSAAEKDEKYGNESQSALRNQQYLSVTCNGIPAILNRGRLGSGGKGRCIEYNDELLTPNEFQARCGKASSKDWKRSIRYHGRPISRLIDQKVLTCHAISCICAACSDDANVQTPVRYFKKWNRKRRAQAFPGVTEISQSIPTSQCKKSERTSRANNNSDESIDIEGGFRPLSSACNEPGCIAADMSDVKKPKSGSRETCKVSKGPNDGTAIIPPLSNLHNEIVNDIVNEQKCWWHLETVAESILRDAVTLKSLVSRTKETSMASKANILVQLRNAIAPSTVNVAPLVNTRPPNQPSDEPGRQDMLLRIMAMTRTMSSQQRRCLDTADSLRMADEHQQFCVERAIHHPFGSINGTADNKMIIGGGTKAKHCQISSNHCATPHSSQCYHHNDRINEQQSVKSTNTAVLQSGKKEPDALLGCSLHSNQKTDEKPGESIGISSQKRSADCAEQSTSSADTVP